MSTKKWWDQLLREMPTLGTAVGVWLLPNAPQPLIKTVLIVVILMIRFLLEIVGRRAPRVWRALSLLAAPADASTTAPLKVVVVHDASTTDIAEVIRAHHAVDEIQPTTAMMDLDDAATTADSATPKTLLPRALDSADAVYVVWSEALGRKHELARNELEDWAWQHMKTPVLIVNPRELVIDRLPFTVIPLAKATPPRISMQLMARTRIWVDLAIRLNRRWIYMTGLAVIFAIALVYVGIQYWRATEYLGSGIEPDETNVASTLVAWRKQHEAIETGSMTAQVDAMMKYVLDDIARATDIRSKEAVSISLFRRESDGMLWTNPPSEERKTFGLSNSIVGCAANAHVFILWDSKCKPGTDAAWDKNGDVIGRCKGKDTIAIDGHPDCTYDTSVPEMNNKAMLCYSPDIVGGDQSARAVCLVTSKDTDKAFFRNPTTRQKLRMLAIVVDSLPASALRGPGVKAAAQPASPSRSGSFHHGA
jgi:hypothetical protein